MKLTLLSHRLPLCPDPPHRLTPNVPRPTARLCPFWAETRSGLIQPDYNAPLLFHRGSIGHTVMTHFSWLSPIERHGCMMLAADAG